MSADIEFSMGLDTSEAMRMADAAFNRITAMQARMNQFTGFQSVDAGKFNALSLSQGGSQAGSDLYVKQKLKLQYQSAIGSLSEALVEGAEEEAKKIAEAAASIKGALSAMSARTPDPFADILKKLNNEKSVALYGSLATKKYDRVNYANASESELNDIASATNAKPTWRMDGDLNSTAYDRLNILDATEFDDILNKINGEKSIRKDGNLFEDLATKKYDADNKDEIKQSEITDEAKAQSREYNAHYIKLSKVHKLLLSILATWQAIKRAVGFGVERAGQLNEEKGTFSIDAVQAYRANQDKHYAMIVRGEENLGAAAPIKASDISAMAKTMQDMRLKAMSGEGIGNEQYVISMQRLFDTFGVGISAKDLLSNGNKSTLDITEEMLRLLENKILPSINKMSGVDKDLAINDVLRVFGDSLADGVMSNLNKRAIHGGTETAVDMLLRAGGNAVSPVDLTTITSGLSSSASQLKRAFEELKNVMLDMFYPALDKTLGKLTDFSEWLADKFHLGKTDKEGLVTVAAMESRFLGFGAGDKLTKAKTRVDKRDYSAPYEERYFSYFSSELLKKDEERTQNWLDSVGRGFHGLYVANAHRGGTADEKLNALLYNLPVAKTKDFGNALENLRGSYILQKLAKRFMEGSLSDNQFDLSYEGDIGLGNLGAKLKKYEVPKGMKTYEDFVRFIYSTRELAQAYGSLFQEGGGLALTDEDLIAGPASYLKKGMTPSTYYDFLKTFFGGTGKKEWGDMIRSVSPAWEDKNRNGVMDWGEVFIRINYNNPDGTIGHTDVSRSLNNELR